MVYDRRGSRNFKVFDGHDRRYSAIRHAKPTPSICRENYRSLDDRVRSCSMQCARRITLLWYVPGTPHMMVRGRYKSKRMARIDALAQKVGKRMFITTALIAVAILLILFLKPEVFEFDDGPHRLGDAERAVPR